VPEALNFIASTIIALLPQRKDAAEVTSYPDLQAPGVDLSLSSAVALAPREPVDLPGVLGLGASSGAQAVEQGKVDLLSVALRLVQTYAGLYASSEAFIELFAPMSRILEGSRVSKLSPELKVSRSIHPVSPFLCHPRTTPNLCDAP
jgi:nucleolar protein 14